MDESHFEIVRQMLEDTAMEVSQIAALLDYADASAFTQWRSGATLPTDRDP